MEKTVDINENSQFMEDLSMFRAASGSHLDEASPGISQNDNGSFKFSANSNPSEQLGLYMKNDEEEEEEGEPRRIEEGENQFLGEIGTYSGMLIQGVCKDNHWIGRDD